MFVVSAAVFALGVAIYLTMQLVITGRKWWNALGFSDIVRNARQIPPDVHDAAGSFAGTKSGRAIGPE